MSTRAHTNKLSDKKLLLLDMNGTFMFGEDRFGISEDFSTHYHQLGGELEKHEINSLIRAAYCFLNDRYPDKNYQNTFPSVATALSKVAKQQLSADEISKIVATFVYHEIGYIPEKYLQTLFNLYKKFQIALAIDIWSPKYAWLRLFKYYGINTLFSAISFSSDHGIVKPSPIPFEQLLTKLKINKHQALVVGDSIRRDLGGASAAGIDCVLVGEATDMRAIAQYQDLSEFCFAVT